MTADETPSRIDRVFGDGSLVNETLRLAPREAIDRHQRLVPASQIDDVGLLLTDDELLKERTARDLGRWFEARLALVNGCPAAKRPALLHQGAFKRFYEEMYPFAHFVRHLVGDRKDVTCRLTSPSEGAPHCDAVIRDVFLAEQPTKRFVTVDEVAGTVAFLCGEAAASITGIALPIDGGWTAH